MAGANVERYDLEHAELLKVEWDKANAQIVVVFRGPRAGRFLKDQMAKMVRTLHFDRWFDATENYYLVTFSFIGVTCVKETLWTEIRKRFANEPSMDLKAKMVFEIDDMRSIQNGPEDFFFYLYADGDTLQFSYKDCIALEKPIESPKG